jgi:hypothetical protein
MVDEDVYCIDTLTQVSAITKGSRAWPLACETSTCGAASGPRPPGRTQPTPTGWSPEATRAIDRLLKS